MSDNFRKGSSSLQNSGSFNVDDADCPRWARNTVLEARYEYKNEDGTHAYYMDKGQNPDGSKVFRCRTLNTLRFGDRINREDEDNEYTRKRDDQPWVPFNLPELKNSSPDTPVFITEGEKDATTLQGLGLTAICNPCGALKWGLIADTANTLLTGRDVVILPDNDERGEKHGQQVLKSVEPVARSVKVIRLPNLREKGDVTDWIEEGGTVEQLSELISGAEPVSAVLEAARSGFLVKDKDGKVIPNHQQNIRAAVHLLGAEVKYDEFAQRMLVDGLSGFGPALSDSAVMRLKLDAERTHRVTASKEQFFDVVADYARRRAFHPVRDYLDNLKWDGKPRINGWLATYAGAKNTEYVQAVGRLTLIAAVRRVRKPGVKFDEILVLESAQGTNKSSALAILAVKSDWFSDDLPLGAEAKIVIERTVGKWIVEAAELKGMKRNEVEQLKAFTSRQVDKARKAYGKIAEEEPRQFVIIGTTNSSQYLRDGTGNRRFWPVEIEKFHLEELERDRDQLWAEAAHYETEGALIRMDPALWAVAAAEQEERAIEDPFVGALRDSLGDMDGKISASSVWRVLDISPGSRFQEQNARMGEAMKALGWERAKLRFGRGKSEWGYRKGGQSMRDGTTRSRQILVSGSKVDGVLRAYYDEDLEPIG